MTLATPSPGGTGHVTAHTALHNRYNHAISVDMPLSTPSATTAAIQAAIDAALLAGSLNKRGRTVLLGPGDFVINAPLVIAQAWGLIFAGCGHQTRILWQGAVDDAVIRLDNSRHCIVSDLIIGFSAAAYAGIQTRRVSGGGTVPVMNRFQNIYIDGGNGNVENGFVAGGAGATDANNDFHVWDQCESTGYTNAGWLMLGSQSYNNEMRNCRAGAGPGGKYAVHCGNVGGSFRWSGGGVWGNQISDFSFGRSYQPSVIEFCNSEGSKRLFQGMSGIVCDVVIRHCRWAGNLSHADGVIIDTNGQDTRIAVSNCRLGDGQPNTPEHKFNFNVGAQGHVLFDQNVVFSSAQNVFGPYPPHAGEGNQQITNEGGLTRQPLIW